MSDSEHLTNIDLFAGVGGFHQGWKNNGVETVWASEWNRSSRETYEENYGIIPAGDITRIRAEEIPSHDVLSAGFPCQAFSVSGKQLGFADTRGTLFFDVARIANHHRPRMLLLENVKNFAQHDDGKTLHTILTTLDEIGYSVWWKVLSTKNFGVPQDRQRVFFACFRKDLGVEDFVWPPGTPSTRNVRDVLVPPNMIAEEQYVIRSDLTLNIEKIQEYDASATPAPKPLRVGTVGKGGQGNRIYHHNGCGITLSSHGGGVGAKTGLYYTPEGKVRKLVPREAARMMGFPDSFTPHPSTSQALQHFGNAVAVPVVEKVGAHMLASVEK